MYLRQKREDVVDKKKNDAEKKDAVENNAVEEEEPKPYAGFSNIFTQLKPNGNHH